MNKKLIIYVLIALIVTALLFGFASTKPEKKDEVHRHFDFKLYLDGQAVDLSRDEYQATEEHRLSERVHMHDGSGKVVHIHTAGVTLGEFLDSLHSELPVTGDTRVVVNGYVEARGLAYQPQDLDRILISHGDESNEQALERFGSVSDLACIYSEKCPERGKPPTETCVGQCVI